MLGPWVLSTFPLTATALLLGMAQYSCDDIIQLIKSSIVMTHVSFYFMM